MPDYWAEGYMAGAPSYEAFEIDTQVATNMKCSKCGGECYYEGWHKEGSYIALAICRVCGNEMEF